MQLGDLIRHQRRALDLSQEELGELMGVHHKTIGKWERGVASPRGKMPKLEEVLGVKLVNRPSEVKVRIADPTTLSNAELATALLSYTAELTRRLPSDPVTELIDLERVVKEGWSATRLSDLNGRLDEGAT
jgi:transcriptional regulator with XRE-family HTH domain